MGGPFIYFSLPFTHFISVIMWRKGRFTYFSPSFLQKQNGVAEKATSQAQCDARMWQVAQDAHFFCLLFGVPTTATSHF